MSSRNVKTKINMLKGLSEIIKIDEKADLSTIFKRMQPLFWPRQKLLATVHIHVLYVLPKDVDKQTNLGPWVSTKTYKRTTHLLAIPSKISTLEAKTLKTSRLLS
jgi:hypothetical protein